MRCTAGSIKCGTRCVPLSFIRKRCFRPQVNFHAGIACFLPPEVIFIIFLILFSSHKDKCQQLAHASNNCLSFGLRVLFDNLRVKSRHVLIVVRRR
ncbi:hypothetical protein Barb4_04494 [Bacteroidales bacterium Barb4]|nr:hypothetical protein Barb4_04494 [Bacteroidales bacterium Barb4]